LHASTLGAGIKRGTLGGVLVSGLNLKQLAETRAAEHGAGAYSPSGERLSLGLEVGIAHPESG
jgi:hypothetical protein